MHDVDEGEVASPPLQGGFLRLVTSSVLVTTSKALVTRSDALVTSSVLVTRLLQTANLQMSKPFVRHD